MAIKNREIARKTAFESRAGPGTSFRSVLSLSRHTNTFCYLLSICDMPRFVIVNNLVVAVAVAAMKFELNSALSAFNL